MRGSHWLPNGRFDYDSATRHNCRRDFFCQLGISKSINHTIDREYDLYRISVYSDMFSGSNAKAEEVACILMPLHHVHFYDTVTQAVIFLFPKDGSQSTVNELMVWLWDAILRYCLIVDEDGWTELDCCKFLCCNGSTVLDIAVHEAPPQVGSVSHLYDMPLSLVEGYILGGACLHRFLGKFSPKIIYIPQRGDVVRHLHSSSSSGMTFIVNEVDLFLGEVQVSYLYPFTGEAVKVSLASLQNSGFAFPAHTMSFDDEILPSIHELQSLVGHAGVYHRWLLTQTKMQHLEWLIWYKAENPKVWSQLLELNEFRTYLEEEFDGEL